jgi:hypothetical protein
MDNAVFCAARWGGVAIGVVKKAGTGVHDKACVWPIYVVAPFFSGRLGAGGAASLK